MANEPAPLPPADNVPLRIYENGLNLLHNGDGYTAIQKLKELLASSQVSDSFKKEIHATLGYIYLDQLRPKEALLEFSVLEKEPAFRETALNGIAWSLLEEEEFVKTIAIFEELVNEYPDGENSPEAYSKMGFCYSRLLSYPNGVAYYQKALHLYNKRIETLHRLLQASQEPTLFEREFIFVHSPPDWKLLFHQMQTTSTGEEFLKMAEEFFNLTERINKNPAFQSNAGTVRNSLAPMKVHIQTLIQKYVQESLMERVSIYQDLSSDTAVELARNMVMEQSLQAQNKSGR
ncbi:MAG: hypothetical protein HY200_10965 [Nitrospirae bacterium]|nr:hypothetical protein [Nitrospirota bacterium]MBI3595466.1 hypothetical protein [Nitrospirota bacterium]